MPVLIVIPARLGSTRLPRKPLQLLGGEPLIVRVVERAQTVPGIDKIVVATDAIEVADALRSTKVTVVMTGAELASGTDRVAAVSAREEFRDFDVVVNLQGDEPFIPVSAVTGAVERVQSDDPIGTAAAPLDPSLRDDPSRVKVVCDQHSNAIYFSRLPIPAVRDPADLPDARWWQHIGVYAYERSVLSRVAALPPSRLERMERLEQLRAVEAGIPIGVALLTHAAPPGIDTPEDLAAAEALWLEHVRAKA